MPQMFPLLWFILFLSVAFSILFMMTHLHFSSKTNMNSTHKKSLPLEQNWKW